MPNEKLTENLVRDLLTSKGYRNEPGLHLEEQDSTNETIKGLLKNASKRGGTGMGRPEFIIHHDTFSSLVIVIECKASVSKHRSQDGRSKPVDYAVDGVLHYAKFLSSKFNVIAIAVSGETSAELTISTFLWVRGENEPKPFNTAPALSTASTTPITTILSFEEFKTHAFFNRELKIAQEAEVNVFARELHVFMREYARLSETEKPLLVSGILLALTSNTFPQSVYENANPVELPDVLYQAIDRVINQAEIPDAKKHAMTQPYSFIKVHPELAKEQTLKRIIRDIDDKVRPFITVYHNLDVVGKFYGEFLKYTGGDKKGLGIVLTPHHITALFARLAELQAQDVVLDVCTGTGGFLISAMYEMWSKAQSDEQKEWVKKHGLIGIEQQANMFALCASNMVLRGDGKANLYQGSYLVPEIQQKVKQANPRVALINPPYAQKGEGLSELEFIKNTLDMLRPNGLCFAIVPMSCAIAPNPMKAKLMEKHTLRAVMSMPDDLFYPVGVVSCIIVFEAHRPHPTGFQSWFGYWKDDGYIKTKNDGRCDKKNRWNEIEKQWLGDFKNQVVAPSRSVKKEVGANDEWCAEAYMETDYSTITKEDFEAELKKYVLFKVLNGGDNE